MKIDLIIANLPYGAIGAKITKKIIDSLDYGEFVNLLPANDYRRVDGLWRHQIGMQTLKGVFEDAAVTTHCCKIAKTEVNSLTVDEFERESYIDKDLRKYFEITGNRHHYAIDNAIYKPTFRQFESILVENSVYIGQRDANHGHLPFAKDSYTNKYNFNELSKEELIRLSAKSEQARGNIGLFHLIEFKTSTEKTNLVKFMYSDDGFRFMSKVFVAMNADGSPLVRKFMPKVDWMRTWTVKEILMDYGYTETEIKEVIDDLQRFKGFNV